MNFNGKVSMITGAAVGIGRATAIKLASLGSKLVLLDLDIDKLNALRQQLKDSDILVYRCDVGDSASVLRAVDEALLHYGKIDVLVNNAAVWRDSGAFVDTDIDVWERYLRINVMGVVHCTKAVISGMIERHYGKIINVASVAGVYGNAQMVHYSATKGAVISLTQALAKEVADKGITVNAVSPGSVSPSSNMDINHTQKSELSYMGRTGSDMENANLICFLASDDSAYITGQNVQIDGCRKKL